MNKLHPKYEIKEGDTIQIITERFGIGKDVWLRYHNNMCRLDQVIRDILPNDLGEIYLLPELWNNAGILNAPEPLASEYNENTPIVLHNRNVLFFVPVNINNKYGVVLNLGKDQIHYEIECKYIGKIAEDIFQIELNRTQVYINNQEPDLKLYELADQMAKAVYPLVLNIDKNRKIIRINNHDEILLRCEDARKKMSQYYVGEKAEKYLEIFGRNCSNPVALINRIEQELFFQLYFLPIQGIYNDQNEKKIQYTHISSMNDITIYNLNIKLEPVYTRWNKIVANIESDEQENATTCFKVEYLLYPEDHSIFEIKGHLMYKGRDANMRTTYFKIYHLNKEERVIKRKILKA